MILKEIAINTIFQHPLQVMNRYTWCVQEQYWSYLKNYDTGKYQKIVIVVDDNLTFQDKGYEFQESRIDVIVVKKYFNITGFLNLEKFEKKKALLDLTYDCMCFLAEYYRWYKEPLLDAYDRCKKVNLEYRFKVKNKEFWSRDRKYVGSVECYWDLERFIALGVIRNKEGSIIKEMELLNIESYNGEFIYYCNCKWDDAYTFSLYSKEKQKWSVKILSLI